MAENNPEVRERVRKLVQEVLASVPDAEPAVATPPPDYPQRVVVNSLRQKAEREFDRDESSKMLITEDDLRGLSPGDRLRVDEKARFTPLARDLVASLGLELINKTRRESIIKVRSVAIGADHGGFEAKEELKKFLADSDVKIRDFGTNSQEAVDYPDFAHAVASSVGAGHVEAGILIDGAGIGSAMAANKVPGARAAACYSVELAKNSREHNGANILTLGSGQNDIGQLKAIVEAFLSSEIIEERHKRRVAKIDTIDKQYRR